MAGTAVWSALEKRQLLRLLQTRRGQPEPDVTELAGELPGRSEAEVTGSKAGRGPEMCAGRRCGGDTGSRTTGVAWPGQDER